MADQLNPTKVITAFKQGQRNNCASIAAIKACIERFGVGQVFKETIVGDTVTVTLKNANTVTASLKEMKKLELEADFVQGTNTSISAYARRCFAVMILKYMRSHNVGTKSAINALNKTGLNTDIAFEYLGMVESDVIRLEYSNSGAADLSNFHVESAYVLYNSYHAAFASNKNYDEYGELTLTTCFTSEHRAGPRSGLRFWAYRLK